MTRPRYFRSSVSTRTISPSSINIGTLICAPVSRVTGVSAAGSITSTADSLHGAQYNRPSHAAIPLHLSGRRTPTSILWSSGSRSSSPGSIRRTYDALSGQQYSSPLSSAMPENLNSDWSSVSMKDDDLTKLVDIYAGDHLLDDEAASKPLDLDALQKELQKENIDANLDEQGLARLSRDVVGVSIEDARGASPHKPAIKASKRGEAKVVKAADGNSLRREKWVLERPKPVDVDDSLAVVVEFGDGTAERVVGKQLPMRTRIPP